jgi:hypothetical protein
VLERPDLEYARSFTSISGILELADGRVIVSDGRGVRLELIDLRIGRMTSLARQGAGPGEGLAMHRM